MQLRLHDLDSAVESLRYSPADQHALAARKIAAHVSGRLNHTTRICRPPTLSHPDASRRHREPRIGPLGNLAEVAFDDDHVPGAQIFRRRALAPVLVTRRQMKDEVARGGDPARFQSRRALRTDPRHRGNRAIDSKHPATRVALRSLALYFA